MRKKNAGFTLVEVVVAVTIAVLVSVAAASVILATRTQSSNVTQKNNAVAQAGSILECFKASEDMKEFEKALEFVYDVDYKMDSDGSEEDKDFTYYIYFSKDGSNIKTNSEDGTEEKKLNTVEDNNKVTECNYYAVIKLSDCKKGDDGYTFAASTKLDVEVNKANGDEIYAFADSYRKGVTD